MSRWHVQMAIHPAGRGVCGSHSVGPVDPPAPHSRNPAASAKAASCIVQRRLRDAQLESIIRAKFAESKSANTFTVHGARRRAYHRREDRRRAAPSAATHMSKSAGAVAVNNRVQISDAGRQKLAGNLESVVRLNT